MTARDTNSVDILVTVLVSIIVTIYVIQYLQLAALGDTCSKHRKQFYNSTCTSDWLQALWQRQ